MDDKYIKNKLIANLQNYLRERMDFIASLPTMDPLWTAQFDIIDDLINPILDDTGMYKCPNLFLLFDGILRSEGIRAGGIEFEIKIFKSNSSNPDPDYTLTSLFKLKNDQIMYEVKKVKKDSNSTEEFPIAISLGISGIQAFYGILENIIRNSGRHSNKEEIKKVVKFSELIEGISRKKLKKGNNSNQLQNSTSIIYKPENGTDFFYEIEINDQKETKYFYHNNKNQQKQKIEIYPLKITIEFYYDWNDNFKENKDDFIKVRIYDNMAGWINYGSNNWIKKENKNFFLEQLEYMLKPEVKKFDNVERDGRIINESGNIVQGNWGMKEMRICASFLRGIKISDYEIQHTPPVITAAAVPSKVNEASLGFEFYIPKVKNLLIVSKYLYSEKNINKGDLKEIGICIEENINKIIDLQNRGVFTHEFVAIDVDDEGNKKFVQENSLLLPYKLFFITPNPDNFDYSLFKNIRYDFYLNAKKPDDEKENLKNLIISKKDIQRWLTQNDTFEINNVQYENCPPAERVYLEVCKRWIKYLTLNSKFPKIGTYYNEAALFWNNNLTFGSNKGNDEKKFIKQSRYSILILHRFELFDRVKKYNPLCIFPFSHGISSPITKIKQNIQKNRNEKDPNALKNLFPNYLNGLEVGLTNAIIIDERIFNEAGHIKNVFVDINFALNWYLQNVIIFNLDKEDKKFQLKGYKVDRQGEINQQVEPSDVDLSNQGSENYISNYLPEHFRNKVHFLIIHQNIISPKIGGRYEFEQFIKSLPNEYKPWYVIITSGRGHPSKDEMPKKTKFLDFSTLKSTIINQTQKFSLTKVLVSLKEEENK